MIKTQIEHATHLLLVAALSLDDANVRRVWLESREREETGMLCSDVMQSPASLTQSAVNSIRSAENSTGVCYLVEEYWYVDSGQGVSVSVGFNVSRGAGIAGVSHSSE